MKKNRVIFMVGVILLITLSFQYAMCENDIQRKLSELALMQLNGLSSDIDKEIELNHVPNEKQSKKVLDSVTVATEKEFKNRNWTISSWAWYDREYTYSKDWDFYTLNTHINYKDENNKGQKQDVYAEVLDKNGSFDVFYIQLGQTVLFDNRINMGQNHWTSERKGTINQDAGINLALYGVPELEDLENKVQEEIKNSHTPKGHISSLVLLLTKAETEQYCVQKGITLASWAKNENDYKYSCDWDNYTLTTQIEYIPNDSKEKKKEVVYSEATKIKDRYYVTLVKMGNETIYDIKKSEIFESNIMAELNTQNVSASQQSSDLVQTLEEVSYLKGRGFSDIAGLEPNYVGAIGYVAVYADNELEDIPDFCYTPWVVPVYQKNEEGFEKTGTIMHKTKIGIIGQELTKKNGKEYQGYLEYKDLETGAKGYIDVIHFATSAYWEEKITDAVEKGYGIATYKQESDFKPIMDNGNSINLEAKTKVLLPAKGTYFVSTTENINYQILGIVFMEKNGKTEKQYVFFNKEDLTLIY